MFLFIHILFAPQLVLAQEGSANGPYEQIVDALNNETQNVYGDFNNFSSKYEKEDTSLAVLLSDLDTHIKSWNQVALTSRATYEKYTTNGDQQISLIAKKALESNAKLSEAIDYYNFALASSDDNVSSDYFTKGDTAIQNASTLHGDAVDLYNNYSGYNSSILTKNWLVFFSTISGLFSFFLFVKSRKKSQLEAEKIRSEVYKALLSSSLWMMGGLVITTAGYSYALKEGGTYYIFYGAILIGGWQLLKGLYNYFTKGRKTLEYLNSFQKGEAIKESYTSSEKAENTPEFVCQYCGFKHSKKSVICKNCGENIL